jgi:hypothetical protein
LKLSKTWMVSEWRFNGEYDDAWCVWLQIQL